jgi:hypothetical protein
MRVYLPVTSTIARHLVDSGELAPPVTGFAVTPGLREHYAETDAEVDLEELEYAALTAAARASLRLIDADPTAWRRRVVLAADVPEAIVSVHDDLDVGVVRLSEPVMLTQIASAHLDDEDAVPTVAAAAVAMLQADLGDDSAQDAVDDAEGNELSWYATQELSAVLELD